MKQRHLIILAVFSVLVASCAPQQTVQPVPPPVVVVQPPPPPPPPPPKKYRTVLSCEENTMDVFNRSGMEVLPFIRIAFADMDGDGVDDLVAGTKEGTLRLYRKQEHDGRTSWNAVDGYFEGIQVSAFSAPAIADIDADGMPEVAVGTGGFSQRSGKVVFYRNLGTRPQPVWSPVDSNEIDVGNDAAPAFVDVDHDGRPDLIVGDSTGTLALFRNRSSGVPLSFVKDRNFFKGIDLGMYAVPAAAVLGGKIVVIAGNSMGGITLLERNPDSSALWVRTKLDFDIVSFAAPAFIGSSPSSVPNLVVSDGDGQIHYYRPRKGGYRSWELDGRYFSQRILAGAACTPSLCAVDGKTYLVVGNINGDIRLFEYLPVEDGVPWRERPKHFGTIKLSSFARGFIAEWDGRSLLITGQQDGVLKAFLNTATIEKPKWVEQKHFFRGIPKILHAAPTVFDLDGDGRWELIVGDVDGRVHAFRYGPDNSGNPLWQAVTGYFENVDVGRYATPSLVRDDDRTYLFVGEQDGRIVTYVADPARNGTSMFFPDGFLSDIRMRNHSSPWAIERNGAFELSVGDYDGNLKHFACRKTLQEDTGN